MAPFHYYYAWCLAAYDTSRSSRLLEKTSMRITTGSGFAMQGLLLARGRALPSEISRRISFANHSPLPPGAKSRSISSSHAAFSISSNQPASFCIATLDHDHQTCSRQGHACHGSEAHTAPGCSDERARGLGP